MLTFPLGRVTRPGRHGDITIGRGSKGRSQRGSATQWVRKVPACLLASKQGSGSPCEGAQGSVAWTSAEDEPQRRATRDSQNVLSLPVCPVKSHPTGEVTPASLPPPGRPQRPCTVWCPPHRAADPRGPCRPTTAAMGRSHGRQPQMPQFVPHTDSPSPVSQRAPSNARANPPDLANE